MHTTDGTPVRAYPLAKDDLGIAQTVLTMQQLIRAGARSPEVREQAVEIIRQAAVRERDSAGEVRAIFQWVKTNFHFIKDPTGAETLGTPDYLLKVKAGDCDDYVVMLGSLLGSLGHATEIVTIAADPHEPKRFSHVYLRVGLNGRRVGLDATQPHSFPGWEPPRYFRKRAWGTMLASGGLGQYTRVPMRRRRVVRWQFPNRTITGQGMGTIDWGGLITTGAQAAAGIITAVRTPPQYLPLYQAGAPAITGTITGAVGTQPGVTQWETLLPWVVGAGLVLFMLSRR